MGKGTLHLLKGNSKIDINGVWFDYKDTAIKLLIARIGNPEYEKAMTKQLRGDVQDLASKSIMAGKAIDLQPEIAAKYVLLDWKGVNDEQGKAIKYTPELGLKYFTDPDFHWFYKYVQTCATNVERFETEARRAEKGN